MCEDVGAVAHFCTFYSVVGALFMLWVALLITHQPLYIGGLQDVDKCRDSAYGAMGFFIFTFVVSIIVLIRDSMVKNRSGGPLPSSNRQGPAYSQIGIQEYDPINVSHYEDEQELPATSREVVCT